MLLAVTQTFLTLRDYFVNQLRIEGYQGIDLTEALFYRSLTTTGNDSFLISGMNMCDYRLCFESVIQTVQKSFWRMQLVHSLLCAAVITYPDGELLVITYQADSQQQAQSIFASLVTEHAIEVTNEIHTAIMRTKNFVQSEEAVVTF